jgi:uncharacterized membrane protein YbhN (UPF0104 family)
MRRRALEAGLGDAYGWVEDRPVAVLLAAVLITVGAVLALASSAGWSRVARLVEERHAWGWLGVCFVAEFVAYIGYVLTVRDMARLDDGADLGLTASLQAVVAGFGVFAATRTSGGYAVDFWAFQQAGATRREAAARATGLGLLEYLVLSIGALIASAALFFRADGHAGSGMTLPALAIFPCLAIGFFLTSPKRAERLSRPSGGFLQRWLAGLVAGATAVRHLLASPRRYVLGISGNIAYWTGDILCLWAALQIADVKLSVAALVLAYSGGYVLTRRALPAGGAGAVEIALTFALVWMGAPFARTLLAVVIYRLFNFWLPILPALLLRPAVKQLRAQFERAEQSL